tara:strand:- start:624 stop:812 length:189 start_codon:yes stop_codon:yes gene_type:complete
MIILKSMETICKVLLAMCLGVMAFAYGLGYYAGQPIPNPALLYLLVIAIVALLLCCVLLIIE